MKIETMINFFKKSASNDVAVAESAANLKGKTVNEVIEEIHETFYTEVDRLLADARVFRSLDTDKQDLIDKCARLKALGFVNTKEVKEAENEIDRLNKLKKENESKESLIKAIDYFSFKYPNYKFITEDSVKKICAKYNLVYGPIENYIGTVPDKNLKHIEEFKIDEEDECYLHHTVREDQYMFRPTYSSRLLNKTQIEKAKAHYTSEKQRDLEFRSPFIDTHTFEKVPLQIAAPVKDFDMKNMEVKDYQISKIEIPDPVVLKPVIFEGAKHYLIVTAWGVEASDELVVNQKMN